MNEKDCQQQKTCDKIEAAKVLNDAYNKLVEITDIQARIAAGFGDIESYTEKNLSRIRGYKHSVKEKQRELKELTDSAGLKLQDLFS